MTNCTPLKRAVTGFPANIMSVIRSEPVFLTNDEHGCSLETKRLNEAADEAFSLHWSAEQKTISRQGRMSLSMLIGSSAACSM